MAIEKMEAVITGGADLASFRKAYQEIIKDMEKYLDPALTKKIKLQVDSTKTLEDLNKVGKQVDSTIQKTKKKIPLELTADQEKLRSSLQQAESLARDTKVKIDQQLKLKLETDIVNFQQTLAVVKSELKTATGDRRVQLQVEANQLQRGLTEAKRNLNNLLNTGDTTTSRLQAKFNGLGDTIRSSFSGLGNIVKSFSGILGGLGVGLGIAGITRFVQSAIKEFQESEQRVTQLNSAIKSTGGIAGKTAQDLLKTANSLSMLTGIEDDFITSTQAMLLTFTQIRGDRFDEATVAILNLATAMNSGLTPSAEQLKTTSIQVGKALNDPIKGVGALRKVGIQLSQEQENQIRQFMNLNDVASAQGIILKELEVQFGKSAEALGTTYGGAVARVQIARGNFKEQIGGIFANISKAGVNALASILQGAAEFVQNYGPAIVDVLRLWISAFRDLYSVVASVIRPIMQLIGGLFKLIFSGLADTETQTLTTFQKVLLFLSGFFTAIRGIIQAFILFFQLAMQTVANFIVRAGLERQLFSQSAKVAGLAIQVAFISVFNGIKKVFNNLLNGLIKGINGLTSAINKALPEKFEFGKIDLRPEVDTTNVDGAKNKLNQALGEYQNLASRKPLLIQSNQDDINKLVQKGKTNFEQLGKEFLDTKKSIITGNSQIYDSTDNIFKKNEEYNNSQSQGGDAIKKKMQMIEEQAKKEIEAIKSSEATEKEKAEAIQKILEETEQKKEELSKTGYEREKKNTEELLKLEKEKADEVRKSADELGKGIDKLDEMRDGVDKVKQKFIDLNSEISKTNVELQQSINQIGQQQGQDLGKRYADINKELENSNLTSEQRRKLEEELNFIMQNTTLEIIQQQLEYSKLSEAQKIVKKNEEEILTLREKMSIGKAFQASEIGGISNVQAKINEETGVIEAYYKDQEGKEVAITDFKNQQYALDLVNKRNALDTELKEATDKYNTQFAIVQDYYKKLNEVEKAYLQEFKARTAEQMKMYDDLSRKVQEVAKKGGFNIQAPTTSLTNTSVGTTMAETVTVQSGQESETSLTTQLDLLKQLEGFLGQEKIQSDFDLKKSLLEQESELFKQVKEEEVAIIINLDEIRNDLLKKRMVVLMEAGKREISLAKELISYWKAVASARASAGVGGGGSGGGVSVQARANGGPVTAGSPYIVGELGPELFIPNQSGTIIPNKNINNTANVSVNANVTSDVDIEYLAKSLARKIQLSQKGIL